MLQYSAETTIDAPPKTVWSVLTDTQKWPEWDPFCDGIEGSLAMGSRIKAFSKLSPGRAFPVTVTTLDDNREMVWSGGMPLGLFKGVRTFTLEERDGKTHFHLEEVFSGPLSGLIGRSIPDMSEPFRSFCEGLKQRAEAS